MSDTENSSSDESIEPQSPQQTKVKVLDQDEEYDYVVQETETLKVNNKPVMKVHKPNKKVKKVKKEEEVEITKKPTDVSTSIKSMLAVHEEKLAKQVITKEKVIYMVQNDKGEFEKAKNPKITARELKKMELQKEKERKEIELGKTLQTRKNGKLDNRSVKQRTPAQIEATKRMLEANKKRREEKSKYKKAEEKQVIKDSVREVVNEPFYQPQPAKPVDPYSNLKF